MKLNEFEKIAKMLAKEHRIEIIEGESWAANIKNRKVYYRKNDIYNLSEDHILGLILHEIAHIHYTSDVSMTGIKNVELTHSTLNMIEDISIEHIISSDYPNAGEILESTKQEVLDTLLKMLPKYKSSVYEKSLLFAATRFEGRGYLFGKEDYEQLGEQIAEIMIKRENEIFDRKQTKDLMPLVKTITDLIIKVAGEPNEQEKQQMKEDGMHGQANEMEQQDAAKRKLINGLKAGHGWKGDVHMGNKIGFVDKIGDQAAFVGRKLRAVLKRNNAMEFAGRFKSGKIKAKRLARIKIMKDRRPFARRIVKSNQSYAFAIASDVSGSMYEHYQRGIDKTPASYALSSMFMVGEALRMAGIPRAMIIFGVKANVVAKMGKAQITFEQLGNEQALTKANDGGTDIAKAMNKCIEELENVRAERKIMIILTDGSSDEYSMREAHQEAIKRGIEPLGITIGRSAYQMDSVFSEKKNRTIEDTKDTTKIGEAFIDILKESIAESRE